MDGWLRIGTKLESDDFDAQIDYIESQMNEIEHKLKQADVGFDVGDTVKLEAQYEKLNIQLNKLKEKQADLNKMDLSNFQKSMDNVGKTTTNVIKKVGKWALAVFGVRAAYGFVRNSVNTLSQYNEKLATDLEYIRFAMASSLQPVIEKIVSWVYKLLQYVNYISQAWFGVNLFANASADAMNKSAKSAKDIKKSLAGFDEMNVANNNSSDTNSVTPSTDLSSMQIETPSWLKWIAENKDIVLGFFISLGILIASIKIMDFINTLGLLGTGISNIGIILKTLGIGAIIAGIVLTIQSLKKYLEEPTWDNFAKYLEGIAIIVAGLALLIGGPTGLVVAVIAGILTIVAGVIENWDKIKEILGKVGGWIYEHIITPIVNFFKAMFDTIWSVIKLWFSYVKGLFTSIIGIITNPFIVAKDTVFGIFGGMETFVKGFVQVVKSLFQGDLKGTLEGFKMMFKGIMDSLWSIAKAPLNLIIGGLNALINGANKISFDVPDWVPGLGGKKFGFNIPQIPKLKSGGIINMPGHGIPLGIGGEAGKEGVIPLTDSQAMEELGNAIGRYITINLTNNTNLDGRIIARQQSKVQANKDFVMNR